MGFYIVVILDDSNSGTILVNANEYSGIKLVIESLRSNESRRVRIGIDRPPADLDDRSYDVVAVHLEQRWLKDLREKKSVYFIAKQQKS